MVIDLNELIMTAPNVLGNTVYDALLTLLYRLFGNSSIEVDIENYSICIRDKIYMEICLSSNECKVYFYNYLTPKEYESPQQIDIRYAFRQLNKGFRLFGLADMVAFVQLKAMENDFIRQHEG